MDELLPYYNRELAYIRKLGAEFADKHPKIAGRLRLSADMAEDPHVSRLVEAFAFLNARIRRKVDDEFPEITKSLLGVLYPHFLAPFPSCCIARVTGDEALAEATQALVMERGAMIESEPIDGQPCRFRTCYPVELWPIRVTAGGVHGPPFPSPPTPFTRDAAAVVRIQLETISAKLRFSQLKLPRLRFYLHGQPAHAYELYQRLLNDAIGVALSAPQEPGAVQLMDADALQPVGFARDEGLVDYSARSFLGYRLISEFFAFPQKFQFIDLVGLSPAILEQAGRQRRMDLFVFLRESSQDLERNIDRESFQLGCTPLVNLFHHRAEPIQLKQSVYEHRIVPDARRPKSHEVFSVDSVVATSPRDEQVVLSPLYAAEHDRTLKDHRAFWHISRRPSATASDDVDYGTEVFLSLADLEATPIDWDQWVADVRITCLNRDLPGRLPFGGGQPHLQITSGGATAKVDCLTPPTKTLRPELADALLWRLVSLLSLNHLSLVDGLAHGSALREVLAIHDLSASQHARAMIEGLLGVESRRVVGRAGAAAAGGFCRGVEITLKLDEDRFTGGGLYLFASVLDRFLGLYATINSFTRTRVVTSRQGGVLCEWPPRVAEQPLV